MVWTREEQKTINLYYVKGSKHLYLRDRAFDPTQTLKVLEVLEIFSKNSDVCKTIISIDIDTKFPYNLDGQIFKNFSNLEALDLRDNGIYTISDDAFFGLKNLKLLNLANNNLQNVPSLALKNTPNLICLRLNNNSISKIEATDFYDIIPNLNFLTLQKQNNSVKEIQDNSFVHLSQLKFLNIKDSNLRILPSRKRDNSFNCFNVLGCNKKNTEKKDDTERFDRHKIGLNTDCYFISINGSRPENMSVDYDKFKQSEGLH